MLDRAKDDQPSEMDRLTAVEAALSFHKKLLLVVLVLAAITTSIAVALGVVRMIRPPSTYIETEHFVTLKKEVDKTNRINEQWQKRIEELELELDNSQASTFRTLMIEQEQSFQVHLTALKNGMRDMAHMVPGSRTWLEIYNEQMDAALAQSKARARKLTSMQIGQDKAPETNTLSSPAGPALIELD